MAVATATVPMEGMGIGAGKQAFPDGRRTNWGGCTGLLGYKATKLEECDRKGKFWKKSKAKEGLKTKITVWYILLRTLMNQFKTREEQKVKEKRRKAKLLTDGTQLQEDSLFPTGATENVPQNQGTST